MSTNTQKFYITTTLPYVNSEPHIGFAMEIVRADVIARYKRLMGYDVFFNTGTDEHGAKIYENALKTGVDVQTYVNGYAEKFKELTNVLGISDVHFIRTTDEKHVLAAQEMWKRCYDNGFIYKKTYQTKYCVGCELNKTDSELENGVCPIHPNREIELIDEENYFFKFSEFQKPLLDFYAAHPDFVIPDFRFNEIKSFVERGLEDFSISRLKSKMSWGVAVPGDDDRDHAFAMQHHLSIVDIIDRSGIVNAGMEDRQGTLMNSSFLDGLTVDDAIAGILDYLEENNTGTRQIAYKLRDANFSRQRYWGEPFPIYYDVDGLVHDMNDDSLPHVLPDLDDFKPSPDGRSPLARLDAWTRPSAGIERETDTMPGYAGSSWYFLRYMDPHNANTFASPEAVSYWQDVDLYVGGVEHAVGHLMYSRFWHKFLYDLGMVPTQEPFKKLVNQGMIQGVVESLFLFKEKNNGTAHFISSDVVASRNIAAESLSSIPVHISFVSAYGSPNSHLDSNGIEAFIKWRPEYADAIFECIDGQYTNSNFNDAIFYTNSEVGKMSKRYHNVVNPDDVIEKYGADCFRMYEMFLGPIEQSKPWDMMGIEGINKFLRRLWSLFYNEQDEWIVSQADPLETSHRILHATIKKTNEDIEHCSYWSNGDCCGRAGK